MTKNYSGPYKVGAMIIMGMDDEGFNAPVLHVPMRVNAKRGQAWCTADPEQEAFAAFIVALLNALEKEV